MFNSCLLVDYLSFTIKTNMKCENPAVVSKDYIFSFLGLPQDDFFDLGRKGHYEHCFMGNDVLVYQAYVDRLDDMGFLVTLTGQGCRYYESRLKDGEIADVWREFFIKLRALTLSGCSVNVSRIDLAIDNYDGALDMDLIEDSARKGELVSQFRSGRRRDSIEVSFEKGLVNDAGNTIYFGSRKSATYCRFYDKKQEQLAKFKTDKEKCNELKRISHWVRMEFEFKREQAVKIVNAICDIDDFPAYYAQVINGYLRFVEDDNVNITRRSVKKWWSDFLGTAKRCKLSVGTYASYSYDRMLKYYDKYLTTTVFTILSRMSPADFLKRTYDMAFSRLKTKHNAIMRGVKCIYDYTSGQLWDFLNPVPLDQRTSYVY